MWFLNLSQPNYQPTGPSTDHPLVRGLGNVFPDVFKSNMNLYEFKKTHMNFTQNEHVKLDKTCLDKQGNF